MGRLTPGCELTNQHSAVRFSILQFHLRSVDPEWGQISIAPGCNLGLYVVRETTLKGLNKMVSGAIQEEEHQLSSGWWLVAPGSTRELLSSRMFSPIHIETQWWSIAPLRFGSSCDRYLYYTTCFLAILIQ